MTEDIRQLLQDTLIQYYATGTIPDERIKAHIRELNE